MWIAWMTAALAADEPVAIEERGAGFVAVDEAGRALNVGEFARDVGDAPTLAEYRRNVRLYRATGMVGWIGGGVMMGTGAMSSFVGLISGDGDFLVAGAGIGVMGATVLFVGTTGFVAGRVHSNRMGSWYAPHEAEAWIDAAGFEPMSAEQAPPEPELVLSWTRRGLVAQRGEDKLTAELFARQVGDTRTWRRARAVKWANTAAGVGLCAVGYGMTVSSVNLDYPLGPAVAGTGLLTAGTGVLVLTLGRKAYTDMDVWYTRREAEQWLEEKS